MENLIIKSPAKINLFLKVIKKLSNGYHELETAFQLIDVFDTIEFQNTSNKINVSCSDVNIDEEENIVFKSATLLKKVTDRNVGANIKIIKNIPTGAGLGGGSSNAASTICALNKMWGLGLSKSEMMLIGLDLGADVPLFIKGEYSFFITLETFFSLEPITILSGYLKSRIASPSLKNSGLEITVKNFFFLLKIFSISSPVPIGTVDLVTSIFFFFACFKIFLVYI